MRAPEEDGSGRHPGGLAGEEGERGDGRPGVREEGELAREGAGRGDRRPCRWRGGGRPFSSRRRASRRRKRTRRRRKPGGTRGGSGARKREPPEEVEPVETEPVETEPVRDGERGGRPGREVRGLEGAFHWAEERERAKAWFGAGEGEGSYVLRRAGRPCRKRSASTDAVRTVEETPRNGRTPARRGRRRTPSLPSRVGQGKGRREGAGGGGGERAGRAGGTDGDEDGARKARDEVGLAGEVAEGDGVRRGDGAGLHELRSVREGELRLGDPHEHRGRGPGRRRPPSRRR